MAMAMRFHQTCLTTQLIQAADNYAHSENIRILRKHAVLIFKGDPYHLITTVYYIYSQRSKVFPQYHNDIPKLLLYVHRLKTMRINPNKVVIGTHTLHIRALDKRGIEDNLKIIFLISQ